MGSLLLIAGLLLATWLSARHPRAARIVAVPALLLCAFAGLTLPDIDQPLPLDHRSALTHSILPAALALWRRWARPVAAGLALGLGLHLSADLFPNAMIGFATVKLPFAGSIGGGPSYVWLAINAVVCLLLGGWLLRAHVEGRAIRIATLAAVALLGAWYLARVDGGWPALALFLLAGGVALRRARRTD